MELYNYKALVTKIIDGDTVDAEVDLGFHIKMEMRLRLLGVDTPELRSSNLEEKIKAAEAKAYVTDFLLGKEVIIKTEKADSFGRFLAIVYFNGQNFNDLLIANGIAKPYDS
mgnify:CR=1 FL=1